MRLFYEMSAAGGRDPLLRVNPLKRRKVSDSGPVPAQRVGADLLWDVEFSKPSNQERSCHFGISVTL